MHPLFFAQNRPSKREKLITYRVEILPSNMLISFESPYQSPDHRDFEFNLHYDIRYKTYPVPNGQGVLTLRLRSNTLDYPIQAGECLEGIWDWSPNVISYRLPLDIMDDPNEEAIVSILRFTMVDFKDTFYTDDVTMIKPLIVRSSLGKTDALEKGKVYNVGTSVFAIPKIMTVGTPGSSLYIGGDLEDIDYRCPFQFTHRQ